MVNPVPLLADSDGVRRIVDVNVYEYSDDDLLKALKYGSAKVYDDIQVYYKNYDYSDDNPQIEIIKEAATLYAASYLFPRTSRDPDNYNKPFYQIYQENAKKEVQGILENQTDENSEDSAFFKVINSPSQNWYQNREGNKPFMAKEGFKGGYNDSDNLGENYSVETLD